MIIHDTNAAAQRAIDPERVPVGRWGTGHDRTSDRGSWILLTIR